MKVQQNASSSRILKLFLATLMAINPWLYSSQAAYASDPHNGPCELSEGIIADNMVCNGSGVCQGTYTVYADQYYCASIEGECDEVDDGYFMVVYQTKTTWSGGVSCISTGTCVLCVAAATATCLNPVTTVACIISAGGCTLACSTLDICCDVVCERDMTTRTELGVGSDC